jgi:hypothetical protein
MEIDMDSNRIYEQPLAQYLFIQNIIDKKIASGANRSEVTRSDQYQILKQSTSLKSKLFGKYNVYGCDKHEMVFMGSGKGIGPYQEFSAHVLEQHGGDFWDTMYDNDKSDLI